MSYATMKDHAQTVLDIQNAVNLTAVLRAWAEASLFLARQGQSNVSGTFRRHPIQVLYMSKVANLMCVGTDCLGGVYSGAMSNEGGKDLFREAYEWCERAAKGEVANWEEAP